MSVIHTLCCCNEAAEDAIVVVDLDQYAPALNHARGWANLLRVRRDSEALEVKLSVTTPGVRICVANDADPVTPDACWENLPRGELHHIQDNPRYAGRRLHATRTGWYISFYDEAANVEFETDLVHWEE